MTTHTHTTTHTYLSWGINVIPAEKRDYIFHISVTEKAVETARGCVASNTINVM